MSERRAALVTGAASGIGRTVAERLSADGLDVLSVDLTPDPDGPGIAHQANLVDPAENAAAVQAALERFGRLDVVVPNPGVQHVAPIQDFPDDGQAADRAGRGGQRRLVPGRTGRPVVHGRARDDGHGLDGAVAGRHPLRRQPCHNRVKV